MTRDPDFLAAAFADTLVGVTAVRRPERRHASGSSVHFASPRRGSPPRSRARSCPGCACDRVRARSIVSRTVEERPFSPLMPPPSTLGAEADASEQPSTCSPPPISHSGHGARRTRERSCNSLACRCSPDLMAATRTPSGLVIPDARPIRSTSARTPSGNSANALATCDRPRPVSGPPTRSRGRRTRSRSSWARSSSAAAPRLLRLPARRPHRRRRPRREDARLRRLRGARLSGSTLGR